MISVYALALINNLTTEDVIVEVNGKDYLKLVLEKKDEFLKKM